MNKSALPQRGPLLKLLAFTLGFISMTGQVLLLRELITVFYGNETAYAVILASWLFWVAAGSFAATYLISKVKETRAVIATFLGLIYFILPLTMVGARCIKEILHVSSGQIIGILPMCMASYLLLAPLTFLLGGLFTFICRLAEEERMERESTQYVGSIYLWEAVGAATGGLVFSFIFVHILPAMHIAFLTGLINLIAVMLLYPPKNIVFKIAGTFVLVTIVGLFLGPMERLDQLTRKIQWKDHQVISVDDSVYGNIAMVKRGSQYSLFESGLLSYTSGDTLASEENVHFALLAHPKPRRVLLIGGGVGGGLTEILKYPQTQIDYVELDPKVVEVSKTHLPKEFLKPLSNPRVKIFYHDARLFVKRTDQKYDVAIVALGDPYTALLNRYYTREFFQEVYRILAPEGILSLKVSSSENYLSDETRSFLQSIYSTLREVFPEVKVIPGDSNIFLSCMKKGLLSLDAQVYAQRIKSRQIQAQYIREYYLPFRLSRDRVAQIEEVMKQRGDLNTDMHPIAYLYDIVLWSTHFDTVFNKIIKKLQGIRFSHLMVFPVIVLLGGWILKRFRATSAITLSIMTTGFSEIIFQVIVIIALTKGASF